MPEKKSVDIFGTFLESLKRREVAQQPSDGVQIRLLRRLAESGPERIPTLLTTSGMASEAVMEAIKRLREADLISLAGQPGDETVALTDDGRQVANRLG